MHMNKPVPYVMNINQFVQSVGLTWKKREMTEPVGAADERFVCIVISVVFDSFSYFCGFKYKENVRC